MQHIDLTMANKSRNSNNKSYNNLLRLAVDAGAARQIKICSNSKTM